MTASIVWIITGSSAWDFIQHHVLGAALLYWLMAVAIDNLPSPDQTSGKFYKWFFGFAQVLAANLIRGKMGVYGGLGTHQADQPSTTSKPDGGTK